MKQRSPIAVLLLSFVPFYLIYWLYVTGKDIQARGHKVPRILLLFLPLILIGIAAAIIGVGQLLQQDSGSSSALSTILNALGILSYIAGLVAIIWTFVYYYRFSKAAEAATSGAANSTLNFILFLFFYPAALFLIQDGLNKTSGITTTSEPVSAAPAAPIPTGQAETTAALPPDATATPSDPTNQ